MHLPYGGHLATLACMLQENTLQAWLHRANPLLAELISARIGTGWRSDLAELRQLAPVSEDVHFRQQFARIKQLNKQRLAGQLWQAPPGPEQQHAWLELHLLASAGPMGLDDGLLCAADVVCSAASGPVPLLQARQAALALNGVLLLAAAQRHRAPGAYEAALAQPHRWLRQAVLRMASVGHGFQPVQTDTPRP